MPGRAPLWPLAIPGGGLVVERSLIDEREPYQGRFFGERPACVGVFMPPKVPGNREKARPHALMGGHEELKRLDVNLAVPVLAHAAPGNAPPGHEEVRCQVDAVFDAGGDKRVEALHLLGIERRRRGVAGSLDEVGLVVVEADGVVAGPRQVLREPVGRAEGRDVGVFADVDTVEALRDPRQVLELEVPTARHYASVTPGRCAGGAHGRDVERRPRRHPRVGEERNPLRPVPHLYWTAGSRIEFTRP